MLNSWRTSTSTIEDPIVSLSNNKLVLSRRRSDCSNDDRYVFHDSKKTILENRVQLQQGDQPSIAPQITLNESLRKKEQKKLYNKLLYSSIKPTKGSVHNSYQPRSLLKLGYTFNNTNLSIENPTSSIFSLNNPLQSYQEPIRTITKHPYKILDAPKLKDDFYNNLLDWSKEDIISVVLDNAIYIWSGKSFEAQKLAEGSVSCIKWGKGLVVGQQTGRVRVLDAEKKKETFKFKAHTGRIGTIDTFNNLIATGSKDTQIMIWDMRERNILSRLQGHKQQVCGVKWSSDGSMLASGGNDNLVYIWQPRMHRNLCKFTDHIAAVKALAWSPHKNSLLATGGGSTDKTIKLWNTQQLKCIKSIDTGSQVCNMLFSTTSDEMISTHGYSLNSIAVWKVKNMQKIATLQGHSYRVLYMAKSPDNQTVLTGSGDQTLRFWKIFPSPKDSAQTMSTLDSKNYIIR